MVQPPAVQAEFQANIDVAIAAGGFGASTLVVGEELLWARDRLEFVAVVPL